MMVRALINRFRRAQGGFTLMEAIIVVGIMTTAISMVGPAMFGALLRQDAGWRADISSITTLQGAMATMSRDAVNAETTSLTDGAAPVNTVTLTWHDLDGTPHTATYSIVGGNFVRDLDGVIGIVARNANSVEFSRSSNVFTFTIVVNGSPGNTRSKTATMFLRSLQ